MKLARIHCRVDEVAKIEGYTSFEIAEVEVCRYCTMQTEKYHVTNDKHG